MWAWSTDATITDPALSAELRAGFASEEAAEVWLRDCYLDLTDAGVSTVTLTHDGVPVFTMELAAED
ncbi:MAG: hypothetical protein LBV30_08120 [Propionibacteriaceae bacterium]|jgi:hypothetical protein|nr:hypothetical protein [Propionibacteriaceae bacterium]